MSESNTGINRNRLFWGSCLSLITTAFAFSVSAEIQSSVQTEFVLTNANIGLYGQVFFLGFVISQVIFSPLCDTIGIRPIIRGAWVGHVSGALLMMFAGSFTMLWAGSLLAGVGAGLVEAGCNPLIVALYPQKKNEKLNIFHMWFPYGNVIAMLLAMGLTRLEVDWRVRLLLILIPALAYGVMMLTAKYPKTEGVAAGVSTSDMLKACFTSPIMLLMLAMMFLTASMELPPSRWLPPVLNAGGIVAGSTVFAFIFLIMGTLRLNAGRMEKFLSPTKILFSGAVLATVGLYLFSQAESTLTVFLWAAVWGVGIAYFWPTMLAFVSEQNPKSGALGLGMMGAVGMLAAAFVTPYMGTTMDQIGHSTLPPETTEIITEARDQLPTIQAEGYEQIAIDDAIAAASQTITAAETGGLPEVTTTQALRSIDKVSGFEVVKNAGAISNPARTKEIINNADAEGGKIAFSNLSFLGIVLILVFGGLLIRDRKRGGYQAEKLVEAEGATA